MVHGKHLCEPLQENDPGFKKEKKRELASQLLGYCMVQSSLDLSRQAAFASRAL